METCSFRKIFVLGMIGIFGLSFIVPQEVQLVYIIFGGFFFTIACLIGKASRVSK
jgi:hypothetical protein